MGFIQRALFTWFITVVFLIMLCLRLEHRIMWSYFLIFIPWWTYDTILFIWIFIELYKRHKHHRVIDSFKKYQYYIYGVLLKIASQIMICLKLEYDFFKLYIMMIPIWLLIITLIIYIGLNLLPKQHNCRSHQQQHQQQRRIVMPSATTPSITSS